MISQNFPIDLDSLREEGKIELLEILESLRGRKCLVVDTELGGILERIIVEGSKLLKENGVQHLKELQEELGSFQLNSYHPSVK
jgi:hypothetical protein